MGIIINAMHYRGWREEFDLFWVDSAGLIKGWMKSGERKGGVKTTSRLLCLGFFCEILNGAIIVMGRIKGKFKSSLLDMSCLRCL